METLGLVTIGSMRSRMDWRDGSFIGPAFYMMRPQSHASHSTANPVNLFFDPAILSKNSLFSSSSVKSFKSVDNRLLRGARHAAIAGASHTPTMSTTVLEPEIKHELKRKVARLWSVVLHDDQDHTYDYVIRMLMDIFNMNAVKAFHHAEEVDATGRTVVAKLAKEEAMKKRDQIMSYGGDPHMRTTVSMKASIEPCEG